MARKQDNSSTGKPAESGAKPFTHVVPPPGDWYRTVCKPIGRAGFHIQTSERLDFETVYARWEEACLYRGDASMRDKFDHAINGTLGDLTPEAA